ncbi:cytochrome P450 [Nocardioides humi]|uniref:Cytochrome P450 n=1 Tax=Nocardioides humi TaxID=449461 RepID=A0ABN2A402_9ACTN|nr:cytochrome P450 [Nocardioides humi]
MPTTAVRFPFTRTRPFDLEPEISELRESASISQAELFDGKLAWLITRFDDVMAVCTNPAFSSDTTKDGYPEVFEGRTSKADKEKSLISMDPPDHDELRRMLTRWFTVKRAEAMRPRIQALVDELIDGMLAEEGRIDLVQDFALPIPTAVICWLLGVPEKDHLFFQERSGTRLAVAASSADVSSATTELMAYLDDLVGVKIEQPEDDIISDLVHQYMLPGTLDRATLVDLARQLLIAGHESTASMITLATMLLLEHPDQLADLRANPELYPSAVEEVLRYLTIAQLLVGRVATEDVTIGQQVIRAGEGVRALLNAANRDPRVFTDPDQLDVRRPNVRRHMAFGYGIHQCLGQAYARVEMQVALETLFRRLPGLALGVPLEEVSFKYESAVHGVHALPVTV